MDNKICPCCNDTILTNYNIINQCNIDGHTICKTCIQSYNIHNKKKGCMYCNPYESVIYRETNIFVREHEINIPLESNARYTRNGMIDINVLIITSCIFCIPFGWVVFWLFRWLICNTLFKCKEPLMVEGTLTLLHVLLGWYIIFVIGIYLYAIYNAIINGENINIVFMLTLCFIFFGMVTT